jgi:four helix bundle protein
MPATNYKEMRVYKLAFEQAMDIFETSKKFPKEETYSLTDQVRRSSRSVCANIVEAFRKRKYSSHFILRVSDSDTENSETNVWLQFSHSCNYISEEKFVSMNIRNEEIGRLLNHMKNNPDKY